jgi:hypothetical protein
MTHKIHFLLLIALKHNGPYDTGCGLRGWEAQGVADEYDTAECRRFEATPVAKRVTCGRCKRSTHFPTAALSLPRPERGTTE